MKDLAVQSQHRGVLTPRSAGGAAGECCVFSPSGAAHSETISSVKNGDHMSLPQRGHRCEPHGPGFSVAVRKYPEKSKFKREGLYVAYSSRL